MPKANSTIRGDVGAVAFSKADDELIEQLSAVATVHVTDQGLAVFDDSSFDVDEHDALPSPNPVDMMRRVERSQVAAPSVDPVSSILEEQQQKDTALFPGWTRLIDINVSRSQFASLMPLVVQAFQDVRQGWSTDYVVLNPDKNIEFVRQCWHLGAVATPEELNWMLMNARKNGVMKGLASEQSFSLSRLDMDSFSFAAEMAMRKLQDRAWHEEQRDGLTLDKLLCSPRLARQFDSLAMQVAPGFTSLQYRWAAMTLRKARRLARSPLPMPLFEDAGLVGDVRPSVITKDPGIYWVSFDDRSAFVGVAHSLRGQVDAFVGRLGSAAVPPWVEDPPVGRARLRWLAMPQTSSTNRERMRSSIFRNAGSRLNFKDSSLFGGTLGAA